MYRQSIDGSPLLSYEGPEVYFDIIHNTVTENRPESFLFNYFVNSDLQSIYVTKNDLLFRN